MCALLVGALLWGAGPGVGCALLTTAAEELSDCEENADCPCGQYCRIGADNVAACVSGCQTQEDCPGNDDLGDDRCGWESPAHHCVDGVCVPPCDSDGTRCGGKCCIRAFDSCCGDVCCNEICAETDGTCQWDEDCCGGLAGDALCSGDKCKRTCGSSEPCAAGCCTEVEDGRGACLAPEYCGSPCDTETDCISGCCVPLLEGGGICAPSSQCEGYCHMPQGICADILDCCQPKGKLVLCVSLSCLLTCDMDDPCDDGCCTAISGGGGVCIPSSQCGAPCASNEDCGGDCCAPLVDGSAICIPSYYCST